MNLLRFVSGSKYTDCDEVDVDGEEKGKDEIDGGKLVVEKRKKRHHDAAAGAVFQFFRVIHLPDTKPLAPAQPFLNVGARKIKIPVERRKHYFSSSRALFKLAPLF